MKFYIFLFLFYLSNALENLQVNITQGTLEGEELKTRLGKTFIAFKGIPYAQPPIEELRFQPPQPPQNWNGVRSNPEFVSWCTQYNYFASVPFLTGEEDCLYLNVYTPKDFSEKSVLPVMVFFHGGGYGSGTGTIEAYDPSFLLDHNIVLVIPNYRLGSLGFLTTGDSTCPGNNGLKDQVSVLKWVRDNIAAFGGDKNLVTIFGESAGAASVELHMLSPLSRGLFHRAIAESGSSIAPWSVNELSVQVNNSHRLGEHLGCKKGSNSKELIKCLRQKDPRVIIEAEKIFKDWFIYPYFSFVVVVESPEAGDGRFLIEYPKDIFKNPSKIAQVPVMMGVNSHEGALIAAHINNKTLMDEVKNDYKNVFPILFYYKYLSNHPATITEKINEFYYHDSIPKDDINKLIDVSSDFYFNIPVDISVRALASRKAPVFYYLFNHRGEYSFTSILGNTDVNFGVCHLDELLYLFNFEIIFQKSIKKEADIKMIELITKIWTEFAKTGKPPIPWTPVMSNPNTTTRLNYLEILNHEQLVEKTGLWQNRIDFWSSNGDINDKISSLQDTTKKQEL